MSLYLTASEVADLFNAGAADYFPNDVPSILPVPSEDSLDFEISEAHVHHTYRQQ